MENGIFQGNIFTLLNPYGLAEFFLVFCFLSTVRCGWPSDQSGYLKDYAGSGFDFCAHCYCLSVLGL